MENVVLKIKLAKSSVLVGVLLALAIPFGVYAFSPYDTHQDLTEQIAKLYNNTNTGFGPNISAQQIVWLRQGVINEDRPPRWLNHFYNPRSGSGWTGKHFSNWSPLGVRALFGTMLPAGVLPSAEWATNQNAQAVYRQFGNQTWPKALHLYVTGHEKEAFLALGHILHLLEDASVPDHTRDDTHAPLNGDPGSPLEDSAQTFTNTYDLTLAEDLKNASIPAYQNLPAAFYDVANYSNSHFVSEDTINNEDFDFPNIDTLVKKDGYLFDATNSIYVAKIIIRKGKDAFTTNDNVKVMPSYRDHLFNKATISGVGVVRLFFSEAEKYRQNPDSLPGIVPDFPISFLQAFTRPLIVTIIGELQIYAATKAQDEYGRQLSEYEKIGIAESEAKKIVIDKAITKADATVEKFMKFTSIKEDVQAIKNAGKDLVVKNISLFTPTTGTISTVVPKAGVMPSSAKLGLGSGGTVGETSGLGLSQNIEEQKPSAKTVINKSKTTTTGTVVKKVTTETEQKFPTAESPAPQAVKPPSLISRIIQFVGKIFERLRR